MLKSSRSGLRSPYQSLGLLDVLITKEKLAIEIAQVDRIQVHDVYLAKSSKHEVLEKLAANATSSHHKYARLCLI